MPTLVILKLDQIGDYVVFRNFIKEIKATPKYAGYRIVLVGNIVYKDFAKALDGKYIDKFIGVNKRSYRKYGFYKKYIESAINSYNVDVLISPTYSRDAQWVENLVKAIKSPVKIGSSGDGTNITLGQKKEADRRYTQLIAQVDSPMFEFDRYKEFFEKLLDRKFDFKTPQIEVNNTDKTRLVAFFPGAGAKYRRWSTENFAKLADFIKANSDYKICILGDKKDKKLAKDIMKKSSATFVDMTGKIALSRLPEYCKKMQFVVSNDTAGLHISAAVGTQTICISNGNNYPRFVQYPNNNVVKVVYSDDVENNLGNANYVKENLLYGSIFDINDVTVDKVIKAIKPLLAAKKVAAKSTVQQEKEIKTPKAKTVTKKVVSTKKTVEKTATPKTTATKKVTTKTTAKKAAVTKKETTKKTVAVAKSTTKAKTTATAKKTTKAVAKKTTAKKTTKKEVK